jgi:hypothetical protein
MCCYGVRVRAAAQREDGSLLAARRLGLARRPRRVGTPHPSLGRRSTPCPRKPGRPVAPRAGARGGPFRDLRASLGQRAMFQKSLRSPPSLPLVAVRWPEVRSTALVCGAVWTTMRRGRSRGQRVLRAGERDAYLGLQEARRSPRYPAGRGRNAQIRGVRLPGCATGPRTRVAPRPEKVSAVTHPAGEEPSREAA